MKSLVWLALVLAACQRGEHSASAPATGAAHAPSPPAARAQAQKLPEIPRAPVTDAYRQDIQTLCDVIHLSKADEMPKDQRMPIIAMWLGPHIQTSEARDFLVAIQPITGTPKADALEAEAHRVGLPGCALAAEWR
jgi:hypothetical protein